MFVFGIINFLFTSFMLFILINKYKGACEAYSCAYLFVFLLHSFFIYMLLIMKETSKIYTLNG